MGWSRSRGLMYNLGHPLKGNECTLDYYLLMTILVFQSTECYLVEVYKIHRCTAREIFDK